MGANFVRRGEGESGLHLCSPKRFSLVPINGGAERIEGSSSSANVQDIESLLKSFGDRIFSERVSDQDYLTGAADFLFSKTSMHSGHVSAPLTAEMRPGEDKVGASATLKRVLEFMCELGENTAERHILKLEKSLFRCLTGSSHFDSYLVTIIHICQKNNRLLETLSTLLPAGTFVRTVNECVAAKRLILVTPRGDIFINPNSM